MDPRTLVAFFEFQKYNLAHAENFGLQQGVGRRLMPTERKENISSVLFLTIMSRTILTMYSLHRENGLVPLQSLQAHIEAQRWARVEKRSPLLTESSKWTFAR
jgi:hypothetical protein